MDSREINHKWYKSFDEKTMTITVEIHNSETDEPEELNIPAVYEVCELCDGKGTHVNPSIDRNGISGETFQEDPDFMESYLKGDYDVPCVSCGGKRVSPVPDYDSMKEELRKQVTDYVDDFYQDQRTQWKEREMGY